MGNNTLTHIAIILDGNGRWAKKRGMPRTYGHTVGAKNVETICRACKAQGVKYLTVYAFSTENWKRPDAEVKTIMKLLNQYLSNCFNLSRENKMRVRVIGDISILAPEMIDTIERLEKESSIYDEFNLTVAINYGGRDEMVRAIRAIKADEGISPTDITEEAFESYLDTKGLPDPDILIRTGGEKRLSNFLLWQLCYTEFIFIDTAWPDFDENTLKECIDIYKERNRRYGNV